MVILVVKMQMQAGCHMKDLLLIYIPSRSACQVPEETASEAKLTNNLS